MNEKTKKKESVWLYLGENPYQAVLVDEGATDQQVRSKALEELYSCPGIFCSRLENPRERRNRIHHCTVRRFPTNSHAVNL